MSQCRRCPCSGRGAGGRGWRTGVTPAGLAWSAAPRRGARVGWAAQFACGGQRHRSLYRAVRLGSARLGSTRRDAARHRLLDSARGGLRRASGARPGQEAARLGQCHEARLCPRRGAARRGGRRRRRGESTPGCPPRPRHRRPAVRGLTGPGPGGRQPLALPPRLSVLRPRPPHQAPQR